MKAIHCGKDKGIKILKELEQKVGLIERVKQGFGKPTLIYIKKIGWKEKKTISDVTKEEKPTSDIPKPAEQETGKEEIEEEKQSESKKEIAPFPKCTKVEKTEVSRSIFPTLIIRMIELKRIIVIRILSIQKKKRRAKKRR